MFEYIHSWNQKDLDEFFRLEMEIENREEEHLEKQKEMKKTRRRHTINNLNDVMFFAWLKNDSERNLTFINIYCRYIMDSIHTKKTYQKENKEQFENMTDEQI